jgi:hypothetical protein
VVLGVLNEQPGLVKIELAVSMSLLELLLLHELLYLARLLADSFISELTASELCLFVDLAELVVVLIVVCCGDELRDDEDEDETELGTWWQVDDDDDVDSSDVSGFISTEWSIDEAGNG